MRKADSTTHSIHVVYLLTLIFNFAFGLLAYVTSTYLNEVTGSERAVSTIYTVGSLLTIVVLIYMPQILRRLGNITTTIVVASTIALVLILASIIHIPTPIILLFLLYLGGVRLLIYNIDLLLEHFSKDSTTGGIRGAYLSLGHLTAAAGPLVAGFLLGENNYKLLFILTAALFILLVPVLRYSFRRYHDPVYHHAPLWKTLKRIYQNANLQKLFVANLLLRFSYAWLVIYTPIYLHEHIGLVWSTIGIIFFIMLLPFVFLEYPLGKIADTKLGEKEIMVAGFIVLALATAALSFVHTSLWWVWALVLFGTRIGASMVESMAEVYFYKKIDGEDAELLGFFKMTPPFAYVIGPLIASVVLLLVDFRFLFVILGGLVLLGIPMALKLQDTR